MVNSNIRIGATDGEVVSAGEASPSRARSGPFGIDVAIPAMVFASALALYALTLAPTVTLVDSGELIVVAAGLGVPHPPGFPLYVVLAHLATLVPIGNVAERVNFASALFAALAASSVSLLVIEILRTPWGVRVPRLKDRKGPKRAKNQKRQSAASARLEQEAEPYPTDWRTLPVLASALASGLLMAFSRTLWSYATIAEVYTLNTFLLAVIFLLMARWRRGIIEARAEGLTDSPGDDRPLYWAAFIFGLALGVHHVTVGMTIFALAALVYATEGKRFFTSKRLLYAALFSLAGLAIYVFLPLAASRSPLINWGDPRTLEQLWWHVSGRQYQVFFSFSPEKLIDHFSVFISYLFREFGPPWFPLAIALALAGYVRMFKADRAFFWFLSLVIVADLAYALNYEIAEDKDAYYLPAFLSIIIAAGVGMRWVFARLGQLKATAGLSSAVAIALVLIVSGAALAGNLPFCNRGRYTIAQDYVENALGSVEPGGMLITLDWQIYSPLLYFREIERKRTDVVAIDVNLLRRSWYFDYLARAYPALLDSTRDKVDAFLEDLKRWEREPEIYDRDPVLNRRINARFHDMIRAFVSSHGQTAPVYVTQEIAPNASNRGDELTSWLASGFQFIPQGLVFRLSTERAYQPLPELSLITRGLADGTIAFEENDVVRLKVLPVYVGMLANRGIYLAANRRFDEAIKSFEKALELDPEYTPARQALNEARASLRQEN
ncbi:MAG TPA: DUF2723 domain-containing protein [Blastocatellia bacterium]|nr:DUF2723 domain-containing protein [Blastocatellia bacterium]